VALESDLQRASMQVGRGWGLTLKHVCAMCVHCLCTHGVWSARFLMWQHDHLLAHHCMTTCWPSCEACKDNMPGPLGSCAARLAAATQPSSPSLLPPLQVARLRQHAAQYSSCSGADLSEVARLEECVEAAGTEVDRWGWAAAAAGGERCMHVPHAWEYLVLLSWRRWEGCRDAVLHC
jgi:hypothetical protein